MVKALSLNLQLENILPALSKVIAAAEKENTSENLYFIEVKRHILNYLNPPAPLPDKENHQQQAHRQVYSQQYTQPAQILDSEEEPVDIELDHMCMQLRDEYPDMPFEELLKLAASKLGPVQE